MNKRGTTLIETTISIFIIAVVVVSFLEALNVGLTGTLNLDRKTSAFNLAKSQLEYIKAQYYNPSTGNLSAVYELIDSNTSDQLNYNISGRVAYVNNLSSLQKITVNVTYLNGKQVQLIGYKAAQGDVFSPLARGQIVTDVVSDMPYEGPGGWALGCVFGTNNSSCGTYIGYYHVVTTSQAATISATWIFDYVNELYPNLLTCPWTWGAPYIGIYNETPGWVETDAEGNVEKDGVIFRGGLPAPNGGCMPGCTCDDPDSPALAPPIVKVPDDCSTPLLNLSKNWTYETLCKPNGSFEFTATTPSAQPAGNYTVLFFNGEDRISIHTTSASVTYTY